ncbi:glycosyltransferase [Chloroflexota bacterium]
MGHDQTIVETRKWMNFMANSENRIRNVLIVSFQFPPFNNAGALRIGKMAKYLTEFGWRPMLLTSEVNEDLPQALPVETDLGNIKRMPFYSISDLFTEQTHSEKSNSPILNGKKDKGCKVNIVTIMRLFRLIYTLPIIERLVFEPIGWYRNAIRGGLEIIKEQKIDVIYSSFGPSVSHFVASVLQRKTGIPWIAEFRDPWSFNVLVRKVRPFNFFERKLEEWTIKHCNLIVTISKILADRLEKLHSKEVVVIPNGFDDEDYLENIQLTHKFTITYTGHVYHGKGAPNPFFEAVAELMQEGMISSENFEIRFLGSNNKQTIFNLTEKYNLSKVVDFRGFVSLKESIKMQKESTVLLLLSWYGPDGAGVLPSKLFEYMGAKRPILALAFRNGETDNLLQQSGCGVVANEIEEIKDILKKWIIEFKQNGEITLHYSPQKEVIMNYTRRKQASLLVDNFYKVINDN